MKSISLSLYMTAEGRERLSSIATALNTTSGKVIEALVHDLTPEQAKLKFDAWTTHHVVSRMEYFEKKRDLAKKLTQLTPEQMAALEAMTTKRPE